MDIDQEIANHLDWIEVLVPLIGKEKVTEEELEAVTEHDKCALGQWLQSEEASGFRDLPEFEKLVESHEAFHKLAGRLIAAVGANQEGEAIESEEKFIAMSKQVIGYLQILRTKMA